MEVVQITVLAGNGLMGINRIGEDGLTSITAPKAGVYKLYKGKNLFKKLENAPVEIKYQDAIEEEVTVKEEPSNE